MTSSSSRPAVLNLPIAPQRPIRRRLLTLVCLLAGALAVPAAAHATTFGAEVNGNVLNQARGLLPASTVENQLKALHKAGGTVGRADTDWAGAEPRAPRHGRHHYNWSYDDMVVSDLAQARLRWEPDLVFAPRWAEVHRSRTIKVGHTKYTAFLPPAKNSNFAAYATAFMKRYGPRGAFWRSHKKLRYLPVTSAEVWNEPDNKHDWGNDINLGDFVRMYEAVRTAIHRVDRHARVVPGGLAWTPSSLPRLLKAFRGKPMDALAFHPYASTPRGTINIAKFAIREMRAFGRGRTPLLANEYGWTSTKDTWGSTKAKNVKKYAYSALIGLAKLHLSEIVPFSWSDNTWGLSDGTFAKALHKIKHPGRKKATKKHSRRR